MFFTIGLYIARFLLFSYFDSFTNKIKKFLYTLVLVGPFCFLLIFCELFTQVKHLVV